MKQLGPEVAVVVTQYCLNRRDGQLIQEILKETIESLMSAAEEAGMRTAWERSAGRLALVPAVCRNQSSSRKMACSKCGRCC